MTCLAEMKFNPAHLTSDSMFLTTYIWTQLCSKWQKIQNNGHTKNLKSPKTGTLLANIYSCRIKQLSIKINKSLFQETQG